MHVGIECEVLHIKGLKQYSKIIKAGSRYKNDGCFNLRGMESFFGWHSMSLAKIQFPFPIYQEEKLLNVL